MPWRMRASRPHAKPQLMFLGSIVAARCGMGVLLRWVLVDHREYPFTPLTQKLLRHRGIRTRIETKTGAWPRTCGGPASWSLRSTRTRSKRHNRLNPLMPETSHVGRSLPAPRQLIATARLRARLSAAYRLLCRRALHRARHGRHAFCAVPLLRDRHPPCRCRSVRSHEKVTEAIACYGLEMGAEAPCSR